MDVSTQKSLAGQIETLLLDETPIGNFIELEGEPAWIDGVYWWWWRACAR